MCNVLCMLQGLNSQLVVLPLHELFYPKLKNDKSILYNIRSTLFQLRYVYTRVTNINKDRNGRMDVTTTVNVLMPCQDITDVQKCEYSSFVCYNCINDSPNFHSLKLWDPFHNLTCNLHIYIFLLIIKMTLV